MRSMLSCRLQVCICFIAVCSSINGNGASGWAMAGCACGTACLLHRCFLTGNKVGKVSLMSSVTSGSTSGIAGVG